jgi:hypothetical protein
MPTLKAIRGLHAGELKIQQFSDPTAFVVDFAAKKNVRFRSTLIAKFLYDFEL